MGVILQNTRVKIIMWNKDGETVNLIGFWPFRSLVLFFNTSIRGFQDTSVQETEGLAMNEYKLVNMPLHGSQRVRL